MSGGRIDWQSDTPEKDSAKLVHTERKSEKSTGTVLFFNFSVNLKVLKKTKSAQNVQAWVYAEGKRQGSKSECTQKGRDRAHYP